jgi:CRISPR-associated endonuclease/helicase Cas3
MYYAHTAPAAHDWQPLHDHLRAVAALAAERAAKFGAAKPAALAGLLHDLGKYTAAFQQRLSGSTTKVDHSTAGAQEVLRLATTGADRMMAELVAYAIAGHHGGMPDREAETSSLTERLAKALDAPDPVWRTELFPDASGLMPEFRWDRDPGILAFQLSLLGRMLFSCLVDADFRDTESHYAQVSGHKVDREWPRLPDIVVELIRRFDDHMASKRAVAEPTEVNRLREEILNHVRGRAGIEPGLMTLTVPTGGGKTLASLAFALEHARHHALDRIIYAIPFTSVIDQTARIFRDVLGPDLVLEHHSAIEASAEFVREGAEKLRLAMEDWAAPIVVTTNVQLFESLFSNRPARCRKLHNLARSVIVLDEAQTIPLHLLRPAVAAIAELARNYGTTIVLCTATQPALASPEFKGGLSFQTTSELAPNPIRLYEALKRAVVLHGGEMSDDDLVAELARTPQALVIVNSRAHALALFRKAASKLDGVVHLTTRQYAMHRQSILADVKNRLQKGLPCRLIATSLVEAGVDLDFPRVWRAEAGLDQIAQAAGRCNREGRRPLQSSVVTVFRPAEFRSPREIEMLAGNFRDISRRHEDLLTPEALRDYFLDVYWRSGDTLDEKRILEAFRVDATGTDFAYRSVAERFRMIESGLVPVIVAESGTARDALISLSAPDAHSGAIARRLQPFTVQVPPRARTLLEARGDVRFAEEPRFGDQFAVLTNGGLYHRDVGLLWDEPQYLEIDDLII